jgi:hypothetical protein
MITRGKVQEFIWAGGDIDGYARSGRRSDITDGDWFLIEQMLGAISIIRGGLAADSFKKRHEDQVREVFDSPETYELLREYGAQSEQTGFRQRRDRASVHNRTPLARRA